MACNPKSLKRKASATALELSAKRAGPGHAMSSASNSSAAEVDPEHEDADVATSSADAAGDRNGAQRMFSIVELLENILLELSFKELLVTMPQVCRHFKDVIDNSASIQQALFFQPLPGPEVHFFRGSGPETDYDGFFAVEEHAPKRVHVMSNPLFGSAEQWLLRNIQYGRARHFVAGQSQIQAFERPEASWRRMLGSQPPVKALLFGSAAGKDHEFVVKKDDWLRVEDYILPKEQFSKLSCRFWSEESRFFIKHFKSYTATYATTVGDKITLGLAAKIVSPNDEISTVTTCLPDSGTRAFESKGLVFHPGLSLFPLISKRDPASSDREDLGGVRITVLQHAMFAKEYGYIIVSSVVVSLHANMPPLEGLRLVIAILP
ncbi:unnamed protein product [Cercospora beticola]|nr:unnamed protein product [Cercospora beticola]